MSELYILGHKYKDEALNIVNIINSIKDESARIQMRDTILMKQISLMESVWITASENGDANATCELGIFYLNIQKYDLAIKYLKMAFELGNINAVTYLADYYCKKDYNIDEASKYLKIICGDTITINEEIINYYTGINYEYECRNYYKIANALK